MTFYDPSIEIAIKAVREVVKRKSEIDSCN